MTHKLARTLFFAVLVGLGFGLVNGTMPGTAPSTCAWANPARAHSERVVFLANNLNSDNLITLSASLAASGHPGVLLLDSPKSSPFHKLFLKAYEPERVVPLGSFSESVTELEQRLNVQSEPIMAWKRGPPVQLWQKLFPRAEHVVLCPAKPRRLLLQSACLAGIVQAPLYVIQGTEDEAAELRQQLAAWKTHTVHVVGNLTHLVKDVPNLQLVKLPDSDAVAAAYLRHQLKKGPIRNVVVANPSDCKNNAISMSSLAPWIALRKRALLLLTNDAGDNVTELVNDALKDPDLERVESLILVADLQAIPMERRDNPIKDGKDPYIEMEPLTPTGTEPFSFSTGRLFNEEPGFVALVLARERLLALEKKEGKTGKRKALVVSNSAGGLPLLEAFSRNTAKELRNNGYDTTTLFGSEVNKDDLRRLLPQQDVFLWEGHHNTLIKDYAMPDWTEPLQPSLVFLQSCLALKDYKAQPLLERGALCVVGSSTRIFSASGGSFALSFMNGMMYENQSMGGSLRQAKNFLLAYSLLKEKRLGNDARLTVANLRSARAFTLWGDPTLKLPAPEAPADALPPIQHRVRGNTIVVMLPDTAHEKATTSKYKAQMLPNGRLAGLLTRDPDDEHQRLVPFIFTEVSLPQAPRGKTPQLRSHVPSNHWVFCWDARRRCGYLLVRPRHKDRSELRFHIDWEAQETVEANRAPRATQAD